MEILTSIDVEDAIREALQPHVEAKVYARQLPKSLSLPCVRVMRNSRTRENAIDTFTVTLQYRAATDAEAEGLQSVADGLVLRLCREGFSTVTGASDVSSATWGPDPSRPDVHMCSSMFQVTAHAVPKEV